MFFPQGNSQVASVVDDDAKVARVPLYKVLQEAIQSLSRQS